MSKNNKYFAKYVLWDKDKKAVISDLESDDCNYIIGKSKHLQIVRFDSQHEFQVYKELVRMFGENRVKHHFKIPVFPPGVCYPNGRNWIADFCILDAKDSQKINYIVEAKGLVLPEFKHVLANLEYRLPNTFKRVYIVFPKRIPIENKMIKALSLSTHKEKLLTLSQLSKLKNLP